MVKLNKQRTVINTIEVYASTRGTAICYCGRCSCPPPHVPNDVQLQMSNDYSVSKSIAGRA